MTSAIDSAFDRALVEGTFPAADLLVAHSSQVVFAAQYGAARENSCFDIASLTKPFSTATLAMMLSADGLIKLSDTIYEWLGGARQPEHREMTIERILNHTTGLPAWQPYFRGIPISLIGTEAGKRFILDECFAEPAIAEPGKNTLYSDIGYMILGEIIEQAAGETLDALFSQKIAKPLGLTNTFFVKIMESSMGIPKGNDASKQNEPKRRFMPTEDCPWRKRVIKGEVHDQNTYALGGVAGQAGLFSTAADIHRFILELMECYHGRSDFIPKSTVTEFLQTNKIRTSKDDYVLGWNRPSKGNSSAGRHFSQNSIGHLGYSGCSMWVDIEKDFWIILLTNRIHPSTNNMKIKSFRPMIHDLIYDELILK